MHEQVLLVQQGPLSICMTTEIQISCQGLELHYYSLQRAGHMYDHCWVSAMCVGRVHPRASLEIMLARIPDLERHVVHSLG
jgi:hypothetical protein